MSIIHSTSIFFQIITLEGDEIAGSFMKTFLTPLQMLDVYDMFRDQRTISVSKIRKFSVFGSFDV